MAKLMEASSLVVAARLIDVEPDARINGVPCFRFAVGNICASCPLSVGGTKHVSTKARDKRKKSPLSTPPGRRRKGKRRSRRAYGGARPAHMRRQRTEAKPAYQQQLPPQSPGRRTLSQRQTHHSTSGAMQHARREDGRPKQKADAKPGSQHTAQHPLMPDSNDTRGSRHEQARCPSRARMTSSTAGHSQRPAQRQPPARAEKSPGVSRRHAPDRGAGLARKPRTPVIPRKAKTATPPSASTPLAYPYRLHAGPALRRRARRLLHLFRLLSLGRRHAHVRGRLVRGAPRQRVQRKLPAVRVIVGVVGVHSGGAVGRHDAAPGALPTGTTLLRQPAQARSCTRGRKKQRGWREKEV